MSISIIQHRLAANKPIIQALETQIEYYRHRKAESDENGFLEDEYFYHEQLKLFRKELKKLVKEQQFFKKLIKGQA